MARTNAAKYRDGFRNGIDAAIKIVDRSPVIGEFDKGEIIDELHTQRRNIPAHPNENKETTTPQ